MKKPTALLLFLVLSTCVWLAVQRGFVRRSGGPSDGVTAGGGAAAVDKHADLAQIQWAAPVSTSVRPTLRAYGTVLDPSPLVQLQTDVKTAAFAFKSSKAEHERMKLLFTRGQSVARSALDVAEMQSDTDEEKHVNLQERLVLEWGEQLAAAGPELTDALVKRRTVLVRVELLDPSAAQPVSVRLTTTDDATQNVETQNIYADVRINPVSQARSFLLRIDSPPSWLVPGQAVTAWLETDAPAQTGWLVPSRAITWQHGSAFVFVKNADADDLKREPLTLIEPSGKGWLVRGHLTGDSVIAITGAQVLLSQELRHLTVKE